MAYTAWAKMRQVNRQRFGRDVGPFEPALYENGSGMDLKSAALRFIHERCEQLKFDPEITKKEDESGEYQGTGLRKNQIPYDMQMDNNRLCLERALGRFFDSGVAEDAYDVYYCFLEIFLGHYGKSKKMVELLSEFESNGSSLLMKHRDHYSHSVYVFMLGLAIYETNMTFRETFDAFYADVRNGMREEGQDEGASAANLFLEYWGLTALFHDIGYPFELPFEQVMSYFEVNRQKRGEGSIYVAYRDLGALVDIGQEAKKQFLRLYGKEFDTVTEILAFDIAAKLGDRYGFTEEKMLDILERKPTDPEDFGYFMDHAFFSAGRLFRELESSLGGDRIQKMHIDVLSAIMLHNSLFKFSIAFYKDKDKNKRKGPIRMQDHPLAFLLMICDELQCWDRTAYGRNSRTELHPMAVDFDFTDGEIRACYYYDDMEIDKINAFKEEYAAWEDGGEIGDAPRLKAYSDMAEKEQRFAADIKLIVDTTDIPLHVTPSVRKNDRKNKHIFLSSSNFLHLYDFAVALHGRRKGEGTPVEQLEKIFEDLALEYQLSTLNRAKNFSRYLDAINCFYTDKPVDYEMVTEFTPEHAAIFAPMEHERWVREHIDMGWVVGNDYETAVENRKDLTVAEKKELSGKLREQMRRHKLTMNGNPTTEEIKKHYDELPPEEQDKDWRPFNSLLKILKKFDGVRIYIYSLGG
ncbi:MAG: hypothetical protein IK020_12505 [Clostridiales bacterium]|nr:hypothetical protein [Clostridiales bacterium]